MSHQPSLTPTVNPTPVLYCSFIVIIQIDIIDEINKSVSNLLFFSLSCPLFIIVSISCLFFTTFFTVAAMCPSLDA